MHLAEAFIQSNLHCISRYTFLLILAFPGIQTHDLSVASTNTQQSEQQDKVVKRNTIMEILPPNFSQ